MPCASTTLERERGAVLECSHRTWAHFPFRACYLLKRLTSLSSGVCVCVCESDSHRANRCH